MRLRAGGGRWILLLLVVSALWGSSFMLIKVALEDVGPGFIAVSRVSLGALVLLPVALARGALSLGVRRLAVLGLVGVIQIDVPFLLVATGEQDVTSSLAGILLASGPIFTVVLAALFVPAERLHAGAIGGLGIGLCGVVVLLSGDVGGDNVVRGAAVVILACLGYAAGPLIVRQHLAGVQPLGVAAGIIGLGALALLPVLPAVWPSGNPGATTLGALAVLGIAGTGIAFLLYFVLVSELGASRASVVGYIAPGFSVIYGVGLLGEPLTAGIVAGLALMLAGSWLAARPPGGRAPAAITR